MHAVPTLPELQRSFLASLYDDNAPGPTEAIVSNGLEPSARLRIYRHSCAESQIGALRTTYPAVLALVGEAFFDQTARGYRSTYPSGSGNLQGFGAQFADYLQALPAARKLPYLPDVAQLEWQRQQTVLAVNAEPIPPDVFAQRLTETEGPFNISLHPSVHWLASRYPVLTIWGYAMAPTPEDLQLAGAGEQVMLWREDDEVAMTALDDASFVFTLSLALGITLDDAHAAAHRIASDFDLSACLGSLAEHGLIIALNPPTPHLEHES